MTAYELAEKAEGLAYEIPADWSSGEPNNVATDIANMLRQQADRIAELESCLDFALQDTMDYIRLNNLGGENNHWLTWARKLLVNTTPQTKPLSDEEVYALWCEADNTELLPEMRMKDGSINYIITTFARAIEERHGIK